jgi:hypothetical protein
MMGKKCKKFGCGSWATNLDPKKELCDCCWYAAKIERLKVEVRRAREEAWCQVESKISPEARKENKAAYDAETARRCGETP